MKTPQAIFGALAVARSRQFVSLRDPQSKRRPRPLLQLSLAEGPNQETGRSVTLGMTRVVFFWYSKNPLKLVVSLAHSRSRSSGGAISARAIFLSAPIWYVTRG